MTASFALTTDPTHGLYMSQLAKPGYSAMNFIAAPLFTASLRTNSTTIVEVSSANFTIVPVTVSGVTTVTCTYNADAGVTLVFKYTVKDDGVWLSDFAASSSTSIGFVGYRFGWTTRPTTLGTTAGNWWMAHNYGSGYTLLDPHTGGSGTGWTQANLEFMSLFNRNQVHLWLASDDKDFTAKQLGFQGNTVDCVMSFTVLCDKRARLNYTWTRNYNIRLEIFTGKAKVPSAGGDEAAKRFKDTIGVDPTRLERAKGPWHLRSDMSDYLKDDVVLHATIHAKEPARLEYIKRFVTELGIVGGICQAYGVHHNYVGDETTEAQSEPLMPQRDFVGAIRAGHTALWQALQAQQIGFYPYYDLNRYDSRAGVGYRFDARTTGVGVIDLSAAPTPYGFFLRLADGSIRTNAISGQSGDVAIFGAGVDRSVNFAEGSAAEKQLIAEESIKVWSKFFDPTLASVPWGAYFDGRTSAVVYPALPSDDGQGLLASDFDDNPANTAWTIEAATKGKRAYVDYSAALLKAGSSGKGGILVEWPATFLVGVADFIPIKQADNLGNMSDFFSLVWGKYTRRTSYDTCGITVLDLLVSPTYALALNEMWHVTGGMLGFVDVLNGKAPGDGDPFGADYTTGPMYYFLELCRKLEEHRRRFLDYFKGERYRNIFSDWQIRRNETLNAAQTGWFQASGSDSFLRGSTRKHKSGDGSLAVIITYGLPDDDDLRPADVGVLTPYLQPPVTSSLYFNTADDELPAGRKAIYITINNGTRTLLRHFVNDVTISVTVEPWDMWGIEVVSEPDLSPSTAVSPLSLALT